MKLQTKRKKWLSTVKLKALVKRVRQNGNYLNLKRKRKCNIVPKFIHISEFKEYINSVNLQ